MVLKTIAARVSTLLYVVRRTCQREKQNEKCATEKRTYTPALACKEATVVTRTAHGRCCGTFGYCAAVTGMCEVTVWQSQGLSASGTIRRAHWNVCLSLQPL